ncbi:tetratricopeptide repeat protein [Methyloglobulus sp.]|uniref:tetratricopeptide repeat protein n=1 Tax=Methyloglobulus sp. TaxID=2518622 RepID=UPI003988D27A
MSKRKTILVLVVISSQWLLTACAPHNVKEAGVNSNKQDIEEILQSAGLHVDSVQDAILKAEKAEQSGKMELAQLYYIKAYNLEPNNVQVLQKMADLYSELRKYDLAEVSLKLILKQKPGDLETVERYGLLLIKKGNYPDAEKHLSQVVTRHQSWRAYNGLGIIANLQGDLQKAESFFKRADSILPNSPELLNNIGFALYSAGKLDEASSYYLKALQINPAFKKAIYNYGLLHARSSNYEEAYIAFAKVTSPAEANNNTGYIAMMNGDYEAANKYLQEAINSSPQFYKKANDNLMRLQVMENSKSDSHSSDPQSEGLEP